jgi:large subunit ribosomal protein L4
MDGNIIGEINLVDKIFGNEINKYAMHEVVLSFLANQRQGTQSTKTRSEVRGGGKKPWRQKGTGRARQGSIRSPQWKGGGVALGPKPRVYSYKKNKKVKRLALMSALSLKAAENEIIVLENLILNNFSTRCISILFKNLKISNDALFVLHKNDKMVVNSVRNISKASTTFVGMMNTYEILKHKIFIITKSALQKLEEVYV